MMREHSAHRSRAPFTFVNRSLVEKNFRQRFQLALRRRLLLHVGLEESPRPESLRRWRPPGLSSARRLVLGDVQRADENHFARFGCHWLHLLAPKFRKAQPNASLKFGEVTRRGRPTLAAQTTLSARPLDAHLDARRPGRPSPACGDLGHSVTQHISKSGPGLRRARKFRARVGEGESLDSSWPMLVTQFMAIPSPLCSILHDRAGFSRRSSTPHLKSALPPEKEEDWVVFDSIRATAYPVKTGSSWLSRSKRGYRRI